MKTYDIKVNGRSYNVTVESISADGTAELTVNGKARTVEICGKRKPENTAARVNADKAEVCGTDIAGSKSTDTAGSKAADITSPLPGVILSVKVAVGDTVTAGQTLAVLEAMKMENAIEAENAGIVRAIYVQKGDSVLEGAKLITIA